MNITTRDRHDKPVPFERKQTLALVYTCNSDKEEVCAESKQMTAENHYNI